MRLFIATTFPADVLTDVNDRVARLRTRVPPAMWTRPESQHLTLAFLGEQERRLLSTLVPLLESLLKGTAAFDLRLSGCGFFPNASHPRVGWLGVSPAEPLRALAQQVRAGVQEAGVTLDGADFRAHLTLCRIRYRWPPACIDMFLKALGAFESRSFTIGGLTLFESDLRPTGAVHTPLHRFLLV